MEQNSLHIDCNLLSQVAAGNRAAFASLMESYGQVAFNFVRQYCQNREMAEEILQDIFTEVWLTREGLANVRNFKGYLYIVARNYAIDAIRKLLREKKKQLDYERNMSEDQPAELSERDEMRLGVVKRAVTNLPPQQQRAWILSRMEGLTYAEIADVMGLSKETVKKYLQYATASVVEYVEQRRDILLVLLVINVNMIS